MEETDMNKIPDTRSRHTLFSLVVSLMQALVVIELIVYILLVVKSVL